MGSSLTGTAGYSGISREALRVALENGIQLELATRSTVAGNETVVLTTHPWLLLLLLLEQPGQVVSPARLCRFAGIQPDAAYRNLHNAIWRLREQLAPLAHVVSIQTLRGEGYVAILKRAVRASHAPR